MFENDDIVFFGIVRRYNRYKWIDIEKIRFYPEGREKSRFIFKTKDGKKFVVFTDDKIEVFVKSKAKEHNVIIIR